VTRGDERLAGILEAARKIAARTARGRAAFDADEDTQIVLLHLVQVIGEVAAALSDGFITQHPGVPWREIIATRDRLLRDRSRRPVGRGGHRRASAGQSGSCDPIQARRRLGPRQDRVAAS
jgi:uncharacterized protein with HEPN domain